MTAPTTYEADPAVPEAWAPLVDVPARIIRAWAAHDADAFADVFTEDGTMILPGSFATGRAAIREFMQRAFAGPYRGTQVSGTPFQVRYLSQDIALMLTEGGVARAGADAVADDDAVRASWLLVREDQGWKLAAYQNSPKH
ncbi:MULTISPECIES: SgcJ/EcaC family oxidoreductase [unclassified Isoptericola]|uniref:SgcJ/EcaC family oxidoreductase n=1 Tax=unclassified Isoptericola TaxID=2623355 RepID=UPI002713044A|nr:MULTISPECIES: SgcJ/EcaC family oxidoreductase [unclassified Isoptericola]MDO8145896.1 SgcJ/EcaC family oxidoreductase [Isoptericola sp. 178]MDO8147747.1 SgcJ/EcaC family oxidoreductase [Isoptericola sp. b515]